MENWQFGRKPLLIGSSPSIESIGLFTGPLMNGSPGGVSSAHATVLTTERGFFYGIWRVGEAEMDRERRFDRYRELQSYVGWSDADAERIVAAAPLLESFLLPLIDDFYTEIE